MFYDNFLSACEDTGLAPSRVLSDLKIGKGALKRWREGGDPNNSTKKKLADYFGVSVKDLSGIEKAPTVNDERLERFRAAIKNLSQEQLNDVYRYMEFLLSK